MLIHYLAIFRYWISHYYYYINIPLLADKSHLLCAPLVVSGVFLLLLLSVEERLQQFQPLLYVRRHGRHGGLQQLQPLLQLSVCWRGPGNICSVQFSSSSDYFISLPAEDDINVRPHSRNSLVSLVFLPEGDERVDWTDFPPSKSLLYIITDQAPWSMWNVSLWGIHSWSQLCWQDR